MPKEVKNTTRVEEGDVPSRVQDTVLVPGDEGWGVHDVLPPTRVEYEVPEDLKQREQVDYPQDPADPGRGPQVPSFETGEVAKVVYESDVQEVKDEDAAPAKSSRKTSSDKSD